MSDSKKVIFTDGEEFDISGYSISEDIVSLHYNGPEENLTGFQIVDASGKVIFDGTDYRYRWDVVDQKPNTIYYTSDPDNVQTEPWPDLSNVQEQAEPLSNEELTEAVADLMYEVSMMQLGL